MAVVKRTEREDGVIECLIDSTNILMTEYDESKKTFKVTFKAGTQYLYKDVLKRDYLRFEVSESQGSVFNKTMTKYEYEKLGSINTEPIKELIKENKGN
jgi:hypothetical protein